MLGVAAGHLGAGDNFHGLGDGLQFLHAHRLILLKLGGLGAVGGLDLHLERLVRGLLGLSLGQLTLGLGGGPLRLALGHGLLVAVRSVLSDGVAQVQLHERELVGLVGLRLLHVGELALELAQQALKQLHDAASLELVRRDRRSAVAAQGAAAIFLLHESGKHARHPRDGGGHLLKHRLRLRAVEILGAEHLDGALQGIDGFGVVLGHLEVLVVLLFAIGRGGGLLALELVDLSIQGRDLAAQGGRIAVSLGDEGD
mmetsp:Transcript_18824/g.65616  ORF Transcript_18824/g.65616 Transcript_18824/m.65616 type:complete len:256 (+) Transcript_18824:1067-1834(+)